MGSIILELTLVITITIGPESGYYGPFPPTIQQRFQVSIDPLIDWLVLIIMLNPMDSRVIKK